MKKTTAKLFLFAVAVLYALFVVNKIVGDLKSLTDNTELTGGLTRTLIIIGSLIAVCVLYFVVYPFQRIKTSKFFNFFLIWTIVVSTNIWFNTKGYNINILIGLTIQQALMHFFLFVFFYAVFKYYGSSLESMFLYIVVCWYIVIALTYSVNYSVLGQMALSGQSHLLGTSYILLYPLPLALCLKNKFWRWFCVIIGAVVVVSSIKRGGVLGFAIAMLTYYFVHNFYINRKKHIVRNFIVMILSIVLVVVVFITYDNVMNNGLIQERLNNISQDDGSGRGEVMSYMFKNISNIPIDKLIFGYGYLGSVEFSPLNLSAHNDFLEVLYDYGLIGLSVYIWFYILVFKKIKLLVKQKSQYAAPLAASFALLCSLSMISHIIIYPYFTWYAIILGVFDGIAARIRRRQLKKILQTCNEKS